MIHPFPFGLPPRIHSLVCKLGIAFVRVVASSDNLSRTYELPSSSTSRSFPLQTLLMSTIVQLPFTTAHFSDIPLLAALLAGSSELLSRIVTSYCPSCSIHSAVDMPKIPTRVSTSEPLPPLIDDQIPTSADYDDFGLVADHVNDGSIAHLSCCSSCRV